MNIVSRKTVNDKEVGKIVIADEVIATIAGTAALEVNGVYCTPNNNNSKGALINWINKKNVTKDVDIEIIENEIYVNISVVINFGHNITDVSNDLQEKISSALELMTAMTVKEVNVSIVGIVEKTLQN